MTICHQHELEGTAHDKLVGLAHKLKGLRPLPPTPADSRIFGFLDFSENVDFWNFPVGFGVWEGLQSIGNGCGLQMDGFSAHFDNYESILEAISKLLAADCFCRQLLLV